MWNWELEVGKGSGEVGLSRCFVVPERSRPFPTVQFIMHCGHKITGRAGSPDPAGNIATLSIGNLQRSNKRL